MYDINLGNTDIFYIYDRVQKDLVKKMQRYTDIHCHLLPGVDDGSENLDMSMRMLRLAQKNGIRQMILTPHNKPMRHNVHAEEMQDLAECIRKIIKEKGFKIKLYIGNEIYYRSDILDVINEGKAFTMAGSSYVLVEFGPRDGYEYIRNGIYQLMTGGFIPILAHVERYENISSSAERVKELIEMGCCIQVNAGSIMGQCGHGAKVFTRRLLKQHLVHFVATDAHNDKKRGPYLLKCARYIRRKFGRDYARRLFCDNPERVIADKYINMKCM